MRAKLQVNFDPSQDCENKAKVLRRPCVSRSGKLNRTSVKEKSRGVFICQQAELFRVFDDISLVKREKIMRGCE